MCPYDLSGTRAYNKASSSSISPVCTNKRIHFYFTRKLDEREKPRYKQLTPRLHQALAAFHHFFFFFLHVTWLSLRPRCKCFLMHTIVSPPPFFSFSTRYFPYRSWKMSRKRLSIPCTANTLNNPPFLISTSAPNSNKHNKRNTLEP